VRLDPFSHREKYASTQDENHSECEGLMGTVKSALYSVLVASYALGCGSNQSGEKWLVIDRFERESQSMFNVSRRYDHIEVTYKNPVQVTDSGYRRTWFKFRPVRQVVDSMSPNEGKWMAIHEIRKLTLNEINCDSNETRLLYLVEYDKQGDVRSKSYDDTRWEHIVPGSRGELWYGVICSSDT